MIRPRRRGRGPAITLGVVAGLVLTLAAMGLSVWANLRDGSALFTPVLLAIDYVGFAVMGAVVALVRPGNKVGWLMLVAGAGLMVGDAGIDVAHHDLLHGGTVPGASAWAVAGSAARTVGWYAATIGVPLLFPDGRLLSRRWRPALWLGAATVTFGVLGSVFATHAQITDLPRWHNPLSTAGLNAVADPLSGLSLLLGTSAIGLAVAQLVRRWRRSDTLGKQQVRLFAVAAALPILAAPLGVTGVAGAVVFALTLFPLPVAVAFAVLARGLYDLSTATNRTLVWLTLSATIAGIYALVIAGVGNLLDVRSAGWLPWVAAGVVAVSFAPLRDALQRGVNRLMFGRWDDPYQVLAALGQHLEASADVDRLLSEVVAELGSTLGLKSVAVVDGAGVLLAGSAPATEAEQIPLVAYGRRLGTLRFVPPAPLRSGDRQLLDDLAAHVAGLLHAHQLARDLQNARERLVLAREEERRRLRRDLHDGLGPALAAHVLRVDLAAQGLPAGSAVRAALETLRADLQATVADVRRVVEGLRPPALDEVGLPAAVTETVHRLCGGTGVRCDIAIGPVPALSAAVEVATYRIVSEAVTNVVRHAGASACCVRICADRAELVVSVTDDGRGLNGAAPGGHGLETMRERAAELGGRLTVTSDEGTSVVAHLPVAAPAAAAATEGAR